jgi:hypothetical protein
MNNAIEPPSSSRRWCQNIAVETLYEDLPAAQYGVTPKAARNHHKLDASSRQRQIAGPTMESTVDTPRNSTAGWACRRILRCTKGDRGPCGIVDSTHNNKTAGYQ